MSIGNPAIVIGVSAVDTAKDVLTGVDSKIKQTTSNIEGESQKVSIATEKMSAKVRQNFANIATTAAGLTAGIVGFATSFDTISRAQALADSKNLQYQRSLETLNNVMANSKSSAADIANAQEAVKVAAERAELAQNALGDTFANFFANVPAQLISFGVAANSIYSMIRTHQITMVPTTAAMATTYTGALTSMNVANVGAEVSTKNLTLAQRVLQIAMGPVGWAILGISTLVVLLATNTFGLRDAFFSLGKAIYEFFNQYFKPLADGMKWFYDNVLKPIGQFMGGPAVESAQAYTVATENVGVAVKETTEKLNDYDAYMTKLAQDTVDTRSENLLYLASVDRLGEAVGLTNEQLSLMTNYLQDTAREQKQTLESSFNLVAKTYDLKMALSLSNEELVLLASNLKKYEDYLKSSTSAANDLASAQGKIQSGGSRGSVEERAKSAGLIGANAVAVRLPNGQINYREPARRSAQSGMHEFLNQDTLIQAHPGERVDISHGSNSSILDGLTFIVNVRDKDAYLEVRDKQNRLLKSRRQILAGAGLT